MNARVAVVSVNVKVDGPEAVAPVIDTNSHVPIMVPTSTDAVPSAEPEVAVIVAVPLATAVTSPVDETLATDGPEDSP